MLNQKCVSWAWGSSWLVEDDAIHMPGWDHSLADATETMAWNSWSKDQTLLEPPEGSQCRDSWCFSGWNSPSTLGVGRCSQLQQRPEHNCDLLWECTRWWNWFYQEMFPTDSLQGGPLNALISAHIVYFNWFLGWFPLDLPIIYDIINVPCQGDELWIWNHPSLLGTRPWFAQEPSCVGLEDGEEMISM